MRIISKKEKNEIDLSVEEFIQYIESINDKGALLNIQSQLNEKLLEQKEKESHSMVLRMKYHFVDSGFKDPDLGPDLLPAFCGAILGFFVSRVWVLNAELSEPMAIATLPISIIGCAGAGYLLDKMVEKKLKLKCKRAIYKELIMLEKKKIIEEKLKTFELQKSEKIEVSMDGFQIKFKNQDKKENDTENIDDFEFSF